VKSEMAGLSLNQEASLSLNQEASQKKLEGV
jgi:hypothetical protein